MRHLISRAQLTRSAFSATASTLLLHCPPALLPAPATAVELNFQSGGPDGFSFADVTVGSGTPPTQGQRVAVDYVMSTTGARYGAKIDSTKDRQAPYTWVLGDGSTIKGLELAVAGGDGVPPMLPGGVRRAIIPSNAKSNLAYADLAIPNKGGLQVQDCSTGKGPIPPNAPQKDSDMGAGEFQRFKNIYCNANRPYQPDLVLDVKLFGKRAPSQ